MNIRRLSFYLCVTTVLCSLVTQNSLKAEISPLSDSSDPNNETVEPNNQIRSIAQAITVKVMAGNLWGSGIIINRQGNVYTVLTNAHVARLGQTFDIQAPDGRVYRAKLQKSSDRDEEDLAILTFTSSNRYRVANLVVSPNTNSLVFAAGFPAKYNNPSGSDLVVTQGKVTTLLPQSMKGGYQLGYTNDIYKGMSGGPLINQLGEVIAVNGKHKHPLWGNTYIYQDGSTPDAMSRKSMDYLSWGIPISSVSKKFPQLVHLGSSQSRQTVESPDLTFRSNQNFRAFRSESNFSDPEVITTDLSVKDTKCQDNLPNNSFNRGNNPPNRQLQSQNSPRRAW
jgi:S1-C subfamily serine protease